MLKKKLSSLFLPADNLDFLTSRHFLSYGSCCIKEHVIRILVDGQYEKKSPEGLANLR